MAARRGRLSSKGMSVTHAQGTGKREVDEKDLLKKSFHKWVGSHLGGIMNELSHQRGMGGHIIQKWYEFTIGD